VTTLVGGIGELYQGDLDVGRRVVERLAADDLGPLVVVEDLHYGAVAVVQRIQELAVTRLVLVGAAVRGRAPGTVERRLLDLDRLQLTEAQLQAAVGDAVTGYVTIDLVVEVALALDALPGRIVTVEVEPARTGADPELSPEVAAAVDELVDRVRAELRDR
jgi:hydrogenase maturation protease